MKRIMYVFVMTYCMSLSAMSNSDSESGSAVELTQIMGPTGRYALYVSDRNVVGQYKKIGAKYGTFKAWIESEKRSNHGLTFVNEQFTDFCNGMERGLELFSGIESFEGFGSRMGGLIHLLVKDVYRFRVKLFFEDVPYIDVVLAGDKEIEAYAALLRKQARNMARLEDGVLIRVKVEKQGGPNIVASAELSNNGFDYSDEAEVIQKKIFNGSDDSSWSSMSSTLSQQE